MSIWICPKCDSECHLSVDELYDPSSKVETTVYWHTCPLCGWTDIEEQFSRAKKDHDDTVRELKEMGY